MPATGPAPTDVNAIFDQCSGSPDWASDLAIAGKPALRGQTLADYSEAAGSAVVHSPASDIPALVAQLRSELVAERPCSFDLAADGVPPSALASLDDGAVLELDGVPVALDAQNGWHLVGGATVQLEGASCTALRAAAEPQPLQIRWACPP